MMLRSFLAVEIPPQVQDALADSISPLKKALPKPLIRWVASRNVHLTLKFLGDVSPDQLEQLAEALKIEVAACEPFIMSIGGLGAFPNARRARILWIGLDAPPALMPLLHSVEVISTRLGYASEDRPFSPHLTIGRVGQNISGTDMQLIRAAIEATPIDVIGKVLVEAVHIFKSELQPSGPVYSRLFSLPLLRNQTR